MVMNNKDGIIHSLDTRTRISIVDDSQVTTSLLGSYCDAIRNSDDQKVPKWSATV